MREIKFRAWSKKEKYMYKWKQIHNGNLDDMIADKDVILRQYTGLKDINVKRIYEGDVCLMQLKDTVIEGKITYHSPCFTLNTNSDSWDLDNYYSIKIIGNIYENPELLEEKEEEIQCPACGRWISIKATGCVCELEEEK